MDPATKKNSQTLVYSNQKSAYLPGYRYSNPRLFNGHPRTGINKVMILGDWPAVEKAYRAAGVAVVLCDAAGKQLAPAPAAVVAVKTDGKVGGSTSSPTTKLDVKAEVPATAYLPTAEPRAKQAAVVIPPTWRELDWKGIRSLAAQVSDTPVINRDGAVAAIEAELARRGS